VGWVGLLGLPLRAEQGTGHENTDRCVDCQRFGVVFCIYDCAVVKLAFVVELQGKGTANASVQVVCCVFFVTELVK